MGLSRMKTGEGTQREPDASTKAASGAARRRRVQYGSSVGLLSTSEESVLRSWFNGVSDSKSCALFNGRERGDETRSRTTIDRLRRQAAAAARGRGREDLAAIFLCKPGERKESRQAFEGAIWALKNHEQVEPGMDDDVGLWLGSRLANALRAGGVSKVAQLTARYCHGQSWWKEFAGLGKDGAKRVSRFFVYHPELLKRGRTLSEAHKEATSQWGLVPLERMVVPEALSGAMGRYRGPVEACTLSAENDHQAIRSWIDRHEAEPTRKAYTREAERLLLWAIVERSKPLSSLTADDATAYRAFLKDPSPRDRWLGPRKGRFSPDWRPFATGLSPRSQAYSLSVINALFAFLKSHNYVTSNPFAGLRVQGGHKTGPVDTNRALTTGEWNLVLAYAERMEYRKNSTWSAPAADRARFVLEFAYGTGLRSAELVGARLGDIHTSEGGSYWIRVKGKGSKTRDVFIPLSVKAVLERYLVTRRLSTDPLRWDKKVSLIGRVSGDDEGPLASRRLWGLVKRVFSEAADVYRDEAPSIAEKLDRASTHWMRHTHATHALDRGAKVTTVRDNLGHASISTTTTYLSTNKEGRAKELEAAFAMPGAPRQDTAAAAARTN